MNCHGHPRISALMRSIAPLIAQRYGICVAMPNPKGYLITSYERMVEYHRMLNEITQGSVRWIMKLYLTETLDPREVERACEHPDYGGLKYYPAGLTTNSEEGITNPRKLWTRGTKPYECLQISAQAKKPTSYHGADGFARKKVKIGTRIYRAGDELDAWDQEEHFVKLSFPYILDAHPDGLHIFEHLSTIPGIEFGRSYDKPNVGFTITSHHPSLDRRDLTRGGLRSMYFCWPILQSFEHTQELRKFMTEGRKNVMAGDDGASHAKDAKYSGCCAAGVNTTECSEEMYTEIFEEMAALYRLEDFTSLNGPRFYGIEPCKEEVHLNKESFMPRGQFVCDDGTEVLGYQQPDTISGVRPLNWKHAA
jgi:dihydroorotase